MNSDEENGEEDEVVRELDVYLSKSLFGKLHLFQYPIQKSSAKHAMDSQTGARIKPNNNKIEMEVAIDTANPNYDNSKGEQIALNVDGTSSNSMPSTTYDSGVMDKQTLQSIDIPIKGKRYIAGVVHNGEVHLTPVSSILQLRPSFRYMDRAELRASQVAKAKAASEAESSQDEADEARAVTFRIKGAETEAARLARERSYAAYEKRLAEEKWITTKFHDKQDNYSEREKQRLLCRNNRREGCDDSTQDSSSFSEMVLTPAQYLSSLVPKYTEHKVDKDTTAENVLSLSHLKNLALSDQLKLLMKNAKIIHFSHLLSLLPNPPEPEAAVRTLQSYAVLVSGCWIVKSEVLYPPGTLSPVSGIPSESVCRARDYILYLFTKKKYVVRREVTNTVKIPGDEVRVILENIAVMRVGNGWELRSIPDADFKTRFPGVCQRQAMLWAAQYTKLEKIFNLSQGLNDNAAKTKQETSLPKKHKKSNATPEVANTAQKPAPKRQRKISEQKSSPVKMNNTTKVVKIKAEPGAKASLGQSSPILLRSPPNLGAPNGNIATTLLSPKQEKMQVDVNQQMNIAGINSTVQQIAVKMQQMGNGSPNHFIPEMNISNANTEEHQENSNNNNSAPFNEQNIKIEKDTS